MIALQHVIHTLDADPAWQLWWRQSGVSECELGIVAESRIDHLRPSADIREVEDQVRANFTWIVTGDKRVLDQARIGIRNVLGRVVGQPRSKRQPSEKRARREPSRSRA